MSNTYFQFKEFTIHQERCAMKVCTDACLFGAWVAQKLRDYNPEITSVIDIGTGTGLLSNMIAQATRDTLIDAIEIDSAAALQAAENFQSSPWSDRLRLVAGDVKNIEFQKKYDLIISNPPFFENDLKSDNARRNIALHSKTLTLQELVDVAFPLLSENGKFAVLLPFYRSKVFEQYVADAGLCLEEKVLVRQTEKHSFFRAMLLFGKQKCQTHTREICIKNQKGYSSDFSTLLESYYLNL